MKEEMMPRILTILLFVCSALGALAQPYAFTQVAGPITTNNATLNGMVTPRGQSTFAWFEWGIDSSYGQVTSPIDVGNGTNVVRISAPVADLLSSSVYRCRLVASNSVGVRYGPESRFTTGRRIGSWGDPYLAGIGSVLPPTNLDLVVGIAAGDYHSLTVKADGTVAVWGQYEFGNRSIVLPPGLSNVIAVAGGRDHSLAVRADGSVVAWGNNTFGQTNVPANLSNVVAVSAGDSHSLSLKSDGTIVGWGNILPPNGLSNIVAISSGDTYGLALRHNGTVVAWGTVAPGPAPFGLTNVVAIAAGYTHSLALRANGTVVGWGGNSGASVPAGLSNVVQIAAGDYHSLALRSDGAVVVWGTAIGFGSIAVPQGLSDVVALACGDEYCMVLASNIPPQATPRKSTGGVNSDLVLSLPLRLARDPNRDPLSWRIVSLPAFGSLFQYASGMRGGEITETNTPVSDPLGNIIFAPEADEFGAPYTTFTVVANDGEYDSGPALATVNIVPSPLAAISRPTQNYPGVVLSFAGLSNATYTVFYSTDLSLWTPLQSASQPLPGQFSYTDFSVTNQPQRFYRIRSP